jgi:gliding motility-associated lipoprotein GldD
MKRNGLLLLIIVTISLLACKHTNIPKPREYFRIDLPAKEYTKFTSECPFEFEIPVYGIMEKPEVAKSEPCWYNLSMPKYKAKVHLTYKELNKDLAMHIEDVRSLVYKHTVKADDIEETVISDPKRKVYGIIYDLSGNTATSLSFFVTDSTKHFLSGSLYFTSAPNKDSLAPVIQFFREDVIHITNTLTWN